LDPNKSYRELLRDINDSLDDEILKQLVIINYMVYLIYDYRYVYPVTIVAPPPHNPNDYTDIDSPRTSILTFKQLLRDIFTFDTFVPFSQYEI
jgi:hypothetical protein